MKHTQFIISFAAIVCAAVAFVCLADVNRDTEWQDVPPGTRVGTVVDLGQGGGGGVTTNDVCNIVTNDLNGGEWVTNFTATSGGKAVTLLNVKWGNADNPDQWLMNLRVPGIGDAWRLCESPNNTDPNAKTLAASEYPELVTTRGKNALGLAYERDLKPTISNTVPSWAMADTPPQSMTGNAIVYTNSSIKTQDGSHTVTASDVGALASSNEDVFVEWNGNELYLSAHLSIGSEHGGFYSPSAVLDSLVVYGADLTGGNSGTIAVTDDIDSALTPVTNTVATWESFLDGSNVVFSITNYISGSYQLDAAKLRVLELTNGFYREVYNSRDEITLHLDDFKTNDFRVATNSVITAVDAKIADKADKAWGKYTSEGGEAPSNTVYMTAPNTVFAGGTEYKRIAVGEGSVCVLTTAGAPVWAQGDEGTFKFQDEGGTNYFGFAKTDSYTIGCDTDGITVSSGIVTLTYNVTMTNVPCIWYKADLASTNAWEQLNLPDGTAIAGASHVVTWEATPAAGTEVCYINCSTEAKGFFRATIEVQGSAKFMTNMPADFSGGILCTDGVHKVSIDYNNGNPRLILVQ